MAIERTSFKMGLIAGAFLVVGAVAGIALSARMNWMPVAESAAPLALAQSSAVSVPVNGPGNNFVPIVKAASPAVVNISTKRVVKSKSAKGMPDSPLFNDPFFKHFFGDEFGHRFGGPRRREENALGSGVIVDPKGYIITNNHVIAKADEIKVVLNDEREFEGEVVGTDPKTDLAVIKIKGKDLPSLKWADSTRLEVGEYVLAIGNPFGLNQTITMGIVSAVGRANVGIADYEDFIQTDAAINPGNSGGALVNTSGELVGINTAIFSRSGGYMGIGFAVPSNMAKGVMTSLIKDGKVTRGWLGVSIQNVNKDIAEQFDLKEASGALISEIMKDGPAAEAGMEAGDVIVSFDGQKVDDSTGLRNIVARTEVGKRVEVIVIRDGKRKTLKVKTGKQPKDMGRDPVEQDEESAENGAEATGFRVKTLTPEIAEELGIDTSEKGVVVTAVEPGSAAQQAGLRRGDVIVSLNRKRISNATDFNRVAGKLKDKKMLLRIVRKTGKAFIIIKP
ncbi:MAG: DegQ family serine endoprotease [Gammaproteobacteria bacterium]|nr:DegQ family serine endoprotease [Gammaproteobacteria bacterium]